MAALTDSVMQNATTQTVAMTGVSAATTNAFSSVSVHVMVEIYSANAFHMKAGQNPTATTSDAAYPGGIVIVKKINTGEKVAFVKQSGASDGTVYVTEQV